MRKILTLISAAALLAVPATAQARGLDSNFSQAITGPIKLEVVVSEDLAHRANNLPKKLSDRGSRTRTRLNSGFSNNGLYGDKEITFLLKNLTDDLERNFKKRDIVISESSPTVLRVTIEFVKPNRPTFNQLRRDPGLSFRSFGTGGAELTANITSASGDVLADAEYDFFSTFNDTPIQSKSTWFDTTRAFSKFSRQFSKKLARAGAASNAS